MPRKIAISNLNARTVDILNTIRQNANAEYQSLVPVITQEKDIPKVGEAIVGYPALANQFISALINRIAAVKVKSAVFNNAYAELKKGFLEFGETVEEVFVSIAKAREFSVEKAAAREFKRTLPDVKSAFHTMNWRVQYPVTIQNEDLRMAFTSFSGVEDMIARIVDSVTTAAEYDEYLLFKYLIIKAVSHGKAYPVPFDSTVLTNAAVAFRGYSNELTFMKNKYNAAGVTTTTPKNDQYIFMDSHFNAAFDVNVLASAFNMDKADFMGHLKLIDDFTTFDNERFDEIRANSTQIEEVTSGELALMADVKAVIIDREWFQVYDNLSQFSEDYVAAGLYWNYFYNIWKTVSFSPFSNIITFVDDGADITLPSSLTFTVSDKSVSGDATIISFASSKSASLEPFNYLFVQTQAATEAGIAVHKYGAVIYPANASGVKLQIEVGGDIYETSAAVATTVDVGDSVVFTKQ